MTCEIVTVVAAKARNQNIYLRLSARTGETISVFNGTPTWNMLHAAYPEFATMQQEGQRLTWETHPIGVDLYKDAKDYWQISRLSPRGENAAPDVPFEPNKDDYRAAAVRVARDLVVQAERIVVFDMETTTNDRLKAEPLSIGLYKPPVMYLNRRVPEKTLLDTLVKPLRMEAVTANTEAAAVHKITPDMLENAPEFRDVYLRLSVPFTGTLIMGYNVGFDLTVLHRTCAQHYLIPLAPLAVIDIIEMVSWYIGDWNAERQSFTYKSLEDAAAHFGLEFGDAHNALADCKMTWRVIEAMAAE